MPMVLYLFPNSMLGNGRLTHFFLPQSSLVKLNTFVAF